MSLKDFAKDELARLCKGLDDDALEMQQMISRDILQIVEIFAEQGHSNTSAAYALGALERLLRFKPLTPITDDPAEWNEVGRGVKQNRRCSSVFIQPDGSVEDIDGIAVSDNGGITWFTSGRFRKKVTLPYLPPTAPKRVYIEYTNEDEYDIITDDAPRIEALRKRKEAEWRDAANEA